ncbi:MAG: class I SAM-dependent methyltransferase [Pirellulales bacterium]
MSQNLAQQYDAIPFPGLPVARSQPDYLETIARLRGMQPEAAARARVLELGCAVGQNLLPLADRYPQARFLGIDQSARQIEIAQAAAREAALDNVEFRRQDILEIDSQLGPFDYIIAHAVYSWVDAPVRDKLLAVCRDHLAPQGIAYVSYKTYPGWAIHDMFRAMMLYDARTAATSAEKLSRARMFLEFLDASLTEDHAYDALVHRELAVLARQSDGYLWHDHLEAFSHPVYFPEFVQHAKTYQLQPAGDAVLGIRLRDDLGDEIERQLDAIITDDVEKELCRDVVLNRTIRQTLLCHEAVSIARSVTPERLSGLYLESSLQPARAEIDLCSTAVEQFSNRGGTRVSTPVPLAKAALVHLGEAWPDYVRLENLLAAACARLEAAGFPAPIPTDEIERLENNLAQCAAGQVIDLHSDRPSFLPRASDAPVAGPLVRVQARRGEVVANRRHEAVRLEMFDRNLIELLDGTRDLPKLADELAVAASEGRLTVSKDLERLQNYDDAKHAIGIALPEALNRLARLALLVA